MEAFYRGISLGFCLLGVGFLLVCWLSRNSDITGEYQETITQLDLNKLRDNFDALNKTNL